MRPPLHHERWLGGHDSQEGIGMIVSSVEWLAGVGAYQLTELRASPRDGVGLPCLLMVVAEH